MTRRAECVIGVGTRARRCSFSPYGEQGYDAGSIFKSGAVRSRVAPRRGVRIEKLFGSIT